MRKLKAVDDLVDGWLCEQLTTTLSGLNSPDDLFNFFDKLRGEVRIMDEFLSPCYFLLNIGLPNSQLTLQWLLPGVLTSPDGAGVEDEFLDPNSQLGIYLRCCILAFNSMTFEVLQVEYGIQGPCFVF